MPLAGGNLDWEPIRGRGERADPARVVAAGGVVREVEVEDEAAGVAAEIRALDRVEQIAPATVGRTAARSVRERAEDTATVGVEPVELERLRGAAELE